MYTPQLYPLKDSIGNVHHVGVVRDSCTGTYVGSICEGVSVLMLSGRYRQPVVAVGEANTPLEAAKQAMQNYNASS
jgi:hypothetical protein